VPESQHLSSINRSRFSRRFLGFSEDWTASLIGLAVLAAGLMACYASRPADVDWTVAETRAAELRQRELQLGH
jgi:hypothetical protein